MTADEVITKLFEDLRNRFKAKFTEEEIYEMKNGLMNKFYKSDMNKYDYCLKQYIISNMFQELETIYKKNQVDKNQQTIVFKTIYFSTYKEGVCRNGKFMIPSDFDDLEYLEQKCFEKDYKFIAAVLIQNENKEKVYDYLKSNIFYQMLKIEHFAELIKIINRNKNVDDFASMYVYNGIFHDFCMHDKYFFSIEEFLKDSCDTLTTNNIISLLNHLDYNGIQKRVGGNLYNKASFISKIITQKQIKFIPDENTSSEITPQVFEILNTDLNSQDYIKQLLENNQKEAKKKIKDKKV